MDDPKPLALAEAAERQARARGDAAALAAALLDLAEALDIEDRQAEGCAAARRGIETLSPLFLNAPAAHAQTMRSLVSQYVSLARRSGTAVDQEFLSPINQALGDVMRAEDSIEDD